MLEILQIGGASDRLRIVGQLALRGPGAGSRGLAFQDPAPRVAELQHDEPLGIDVRGPFQDPGFERFQHDLARRLAIAKQQVCEAVKGLLPGISVGHEAETLETGAFSNKCESGARRFLYR